MFASVDELNIFVLPACATPLTDQVKVGAEPPLVGVAVKPTAEPIQTGLAGLAVIVTVGTLGARTVITWVVSPLPPAFVACKVNVYVPGVVKVTVGFCAAVSGLNTTPAVGFTVQAHAVMGPLVAEPFNVSVED